MTWWQEFFDSTYRELWAPLHSPEQCEAEAQALVELLDLGPGARVLDTPCGYGRLSLPLARRGLRVRAVDYSADLLSHAREQAAQCELGDAIEFVRADLRYCDLGSDFAAALNVFSSIGYGTEDDDQRVLGNICRALAPGGKLFLETIHRDAIVQRRSLQQTTGLRGPDGTMLRERNCFDPVQGQIRSSWTWNSPTRSGSRHSVIRIYSATELVALLRKAGFADIQCRVGTSTSSFTEDSLGERLGLLCTKG